MSPVKRIQNANYNTVLYCRSLIASFMTLMYCVFERFLLNNAVKTLCVIKADCGGTQEAEKDANHHTKSWTPGHAEGR